MKRHTPAALDAALQGMVARATLAGAPQRVAEDARKATEARFLTEHASARVAEPRMESYFWGVIRKRALNGGAPAIVQLMVAASLASELSEAGHSAEAVARATT